MTQNDRPRPVFLGTYFDRSMVLRVSRWIIILGWMVLAISLLEYGYNAYLNISGAVLNQYPVDFTFLALSLKGPLQGALGLALLYAAAQFLLILLDIEDNSRRAARNAGRVGGGK